MSAIYDLDLKSGRALTEADVNAGSNIAVIGNDIAENLMAGVDPLGKEIRVNGQVYTVIGVARPKGKTLGQSQDNWVVLPLSSWYKQFGSQKTSLRIWGKADGVGAPLEMAIDQVRVVMRSRRHDAPGKPDSFEAETNQSFLSIWANLSGTFFHGGGGAGFDFADCGRRGDYEHHAGFGNGTDAGDRDSQGSGSTLGRRDAAVPD